MQLWNFAKCSQIAEETDAKASDGYIRICKMRMARIIAAAVCICLLAAMLLPCLSCAEEQNTLRGYDTRTRKYQYASKRCF